MVKEDFINAKMAKAREAAEAEWEKYYQSKHSTPEGVAFSLRMKEKVSRYAQQAKKDMDFRSRLASISGYQGIYNTVNMFILHLIRRNCDVGYQVKTLSAQDVGKAEEIVDFVLELCMSEKWRKLHGGDENEG